MGKDLQVKNLSASVSEDELCKLFSAVGAVTAVHLLFDHASGVFKGSGYVRMATAEQADEAAALLNGALLGGRQISVKTVSEVQLRRIV